MGHILNYKQAHYVTTRAFQCLQRPALVACLEVMNPNRFLYHCMLLACFSSLSVQEHLPNG